MDDLINQASAKFSKILEVVRVDLGTIRTGKASSALLENVSVEAYGSKMKLVELASIAASDPTTLLITPFDVQNVNAIVKAIQEANLGLSVIPQESNVRVVVPALSQERRQEYVKLAKTKIEGGKVMIRQVRHESMGEVAKLTADDDSKDRLEKEIQKLTDSTVEKLDAMLTEKEKELVTV